ncbi:MAG: NlpC/P60 family protein [Bacteroidia bacterium]
MAQKSSTCEKGNSGFKKELFTQYYETHCLEPDSACNPYLYYQVYDWLGTKYKFSGNSKKGIDCSGFVGEVYKSTYCVDLERRSSDIWPNVQPVLKKDLQEGDIIFFKIKRNQISHVGLYLGNNKFAHASVHSGVTINDLDDKYYKKYFYKGGRVLHNNDLNDSDLIIK